MLSVLLQDIDDEFSAVWLLELLWLAVVGKKPNCGGEDKEESGRSMGEAADMPDTEK